MQVEKQNTDLCCHGDKHMPLCVLSVGYLQNVAQVLPRHEPYKSDRSTLLRCQLELVTDTRRLKDLQLNCQFCH